MTSQKNTKAEKRANALRDNLKRRKSKEKAATQAETAEKSAAPTNPSDKT